MSEADSLAEAFRQLGSTSAVLGGLAFTAAVAILAVGAGTADRRALTRPAAITAGTAIASAACLIVSSLAWSLLTVQAVRASAEEHGLDPSVAALNRPASIAFIGGLVFLFASVGASGWIASRALGMVTSAIALLSGAVALLFVLRFAS